MAGKNGVRLDELKILNYVYSTWLTYGQKVTPTAVELEAGVERERTGGLITGLEKAGLLRKEEDRRDASLVIPVYSISEAGIEKLVALANIKRDRKNEALAAKAHRYKMSREE